MSLIIKKSTIEIPGVKSSSFLESDIGLPDGQSSAKRRDPIKKIVLHWTAGFSNDPNKLKKTFIERNVSAHFFIDRDGKIYQFLDPDDRQAYHSSGYNNDSIGIEIQNPGTLLNGNDDGRESYETTLLGKRRILLKFTPAQVATVKKFCTYLCKSYSIPYRVPTNESNELIVERFNAKSFEGILGHYHISTTGKADPGTDLLQALLEDTDPEPVNATQLDGTIPEQELPAKRKRPKPEISPERVKALTQDRKDPPEGNDNYAILAAEDDDIASLDKNAGTKLDISDFSNDILQPYQQFKAQMDALNQVTTLDHAQAVPVLTVYTVGDSDEPVNLNKEIFNVSPLHNMFETQDRDDYTNLERPIASLLNWSVTLQQVGTGGPYVKALGTLKIKVHNANLVRATHPKGKYIYYLLKQGYPLRVRYGVTHPEQRLATAFQWVEEDFCVAQHVMSVNDDQTIDITLTCNPAQEHLFSRILIGENSPVTITDQDIKEISAIGAGSAQLKKDLQTVLSANNTEDEKLGSSDYRTRSGTIYSILHGAANRLDMLRKQEGVQPIRIENLTNGLQGLQAKLLTKRYDNLFSERGYLYKNVKNIDYVATNLGPTINLLIRPEIEKIASLVAGNGVSIGRKYSTDTGASTIEEAADKKSKINVPVRSGVKIIFGNFNKKAGQWAGKPISTFPLKLETLFAHLRQERDVGKFSSTIDSLMNVIHRIVHERENYIAKDGRDNSIEPPSVKYVFYPSSDNKNWIFYVYDDAQRKVEVSELINKNFSSITKDQVKKICNQTFTPYLEPGSEFNNIRTMSANTQAQGLIASHNFFQANSMVNSQRDLDGASQDELPSGITRELMSGITANSREVIQQSELIMPLSVNVDHFIMVRSLPFNPIYIFFPINLFSAVYSIKSLVHEVQKDFVSTKMECQIETATINKEPQ